MSLLEFCKARNIPFNDNEDRFYKLVKQKFCLKQYSRALESYEKAMAKKFKESAELCCSDSSSVSSSSDSLKKLPQIVNVTAEEQKLIDQMQSIVNSPVNLSKML